MLRGLRCWNAMSAVGRRLHADYYTVKSKIAPEMKDNPLPRQLYIQIKAAGPITVAEYMKQVLIHPMGGYYMHKEAIGPSGDFITSPELSQMFGEMIAIWLLNEWQKVGSPKPLNIIELGPGHGSLMQDLLRVFERFDALAGGASVHLVEVSELQADTQARRLCMNTRRVADAPFYKEGVNSSGLPIRWYYNFAQLPDAGFTFLIAHEFFDALPVHKFVRTPAGYRELLIDIDEGDDDNNSIATPKFRFVRASGPTPASIAFVRAEETRADVEVAPDALTLAEDVSRRLEAHGGFALIADYGGDGVGDTLRAYRAHEQRNPLVEPGAADLTADVDFEALQRVMRDQGGTITFGPISQRRFLLAMGMRERLERLKAAADSMEVRDALDSTFAMLTEDAHMGARFKFLAVVPAVLADHLRKFPPIGFE